MTKEELIERAKRQLNAGQAQPRAWPDSEIDISACVMQAQSRVAYMVMRNSALRGLLQQEYPIPLDGSGKGDLLTALGSVTGVAGEILLEGLHFGVVIDAAGNVLQPLFHYADFIRPQPTQFGYYFIKDRDKILTRTIDQGVNGPNDIQGTAGPLVITANYEPASVANFPEELEDNLVQTLVDIVAIKTTPANAYSR